MSQNQHNTSQLIPSFLILSYESVKSEEVKLCILRTFVLITNGERVLVSGTIKNL